ncbi:MAG: ribonuclease PH [candidate division WOR-3 bacterium]
MREYSLKMNYLKNEKASCLVSMGNTQVLCVATLQKKLPPFINPEESGWITAEYAMLPRSSTNRIERERGKINSRSTEIQRLIGRSLRASVDLGKMKNVSIIVDCDVIVADGGTRCASINGGMAVLYVLVSNLVREGIITENPFKTYIGAISGGIVDQKIVIDLDYENDSKSSSDFNFVLDDQGKIVEIQGTSERDNISKEDFDKIFEKAKKEIMKIIDFSKKKVKYGKI